VIQLFSLTSLLIALASCLPGSPLGFGARLDHLGFNLWQTLFQPPQPTVDPHLLLVELPAAITGVQQPSWETTSEFNRLLAALRRYDAAAIGITADLTVALPQEQDVIALLPPTGRSASNSDVYHQLQQTLQTATVAWLSPPPALGDYRRPTVERESRWPPFYNLHQQLLQKMLPAHSNKPATPVPAPATQSLLYYQDNHITAGFELTLLSLANSSVALRWQIPDTLYIGKAGRPVSLYGSIKPWPQDEAIATLQTNALDSRKLTGSVVSPDVSQRIKQKIVLLGNAEDTHWQHAAARLNALMTAQYSHSPWWQALPLGLLTLLLWCCSVYAMNRWSSRSLLLGTALLATFTLSVSIAVQQSFNLWLATGDTIVYVLAIGTLLVLRRLWRDGQINLKLEADDARLQLADLHLQHSNPEAAIIPLQRAAMCSDTAAMLVKTAEAFAQQGNTAAAVHAYRNIQRHIPHHREAARALDAISQHDTGTRSLGSTLMLANASPSLPQLGRYQLIRPLGKGAMGEVFLANDPKIRRQVAIKTLLFNTIEQSRDSARERFFREAETAGQLEHPNIVSIYDVGEEGDLAYIAMEYVPGGTLADWTDPPQLLDLDKLYHLMEQVAQALTYAHQRNIVHRDIKPSNLLFNPDDLTIKVTDFGIARLTDYSRTRTGTILGSPYYMSPEQVSGQAIGPPSDLYSLGITFYQLACGSLPFDADSLAQLAWQITNEAHPNIGRQRKGLPRSCGRIINQALAKDPAQRFTDAADMSTEFQKGARALASAARKAG
jgi:hypothetical protein